MSNAPKASATQHGQDQSNGTGLSFWAGPGTLILPLGNAPATTSKKQIDGKYIVQPWGCHASHSLNLTSAASAALSHDLLGGPPTHYHVFIMTDDEQLWDVDCKRQFLARRQSGWL